MKKASIFSTIFLALSFSGFAQSDRNRVNINAGPSLHGTGDLGGFSISLMHEHDFSRKIGISNGLTTTIHYGKDHAPAAPENRLMHFTTAGIQLTSFGQYHIIAKRDIKVSFHAGPLLRFQSSSQPSIYAFRQDPNSYPEPYYVIYKYEKPNTITVGYNAGFTAKTRIAPQYFAGARLGFQNDTNGDVITSICLLFERVLSETVRR